MGSFSLMHWLVVLLVVLILFGPRRLPDLGSGLGKAIHNFRRGLREGGEIGEDGKPKLPDTEADKK